MIIAVGGATATGKSALAVELAKRFNGEIISADSMQIYKGMDIGTAKVTEEEKQGIQHHLIDIVDPKEPYNAAMYVEDAERALNDIVSRGKTPIMTGGTGLYIRSFLYNYSHGAFDEALRAQLNKEAEENGADALWEKLKAVDPAAAEKIHKNNVKRVVRALEVMMLTSRSITETESVENKREHILFCIETDRAMLYERINERVDKMFERGLEEEIDRLLGEGVDFSCQSMQAIGYKEFLPYKEARCGIEEVKEAIRLNTRHYAKRQETWFRGMESNWLKLDKIDVMADKIEQIISK
ncbi:MAG: tRNA (adenosine(37)-N6)-dimethylallyltransferase MiaA [Clostridia bacterium]|nr:tRNA (adenosine(37)-N6)-dimethylallyltransferase MiaA [Clostridia bacterium]